MTSNSDLHSRIEALEKKVDEHIHDGIDVWKAIETVKNDLGWIKRSLWGLIGIGITVCGFLVKLVLFNLPMRP